MINMTDEIYIERKTSCTRGEAAAKLMGWLRGSIRNNTLHLDKNGSISLDQLTFAHSLDGSPLDYLEGLLKVAQRELYEVAEIDGGVYIHEKAEAVEHITDLIDKIGDFLSKIDCEIAKGELSELIFDRQATAKFGVDYIMLDSLDQWSRKRLNICILPTFSLTEKTPEPRAQPSALEKPWEKVDSRDPPAVQPWYTPARYFARQLVSSDTSLLRKKDLLAKEVVKSLSRVGIFKRGGKKPFEPGTIKKAFNVCFG